MKTPRSARAPVSARARPAAPSTLSPEQRSGNHTLSATEPARATPRKAGRTTMTRTSLLTLFAALLCLGVAAPGAQAQGQLTALVFWGAYYPFGMPTTGTNSAVSTGGGHSVA